MAWRAHSMAGMTVFDNPAGVPAPPPGRYSYVARIDLGPRILLMHTRSDGCGNQPVIGGWLPQPSDSTSAPAPDLSEMRACRPAAAMAPVRQGRRGEGQEAGRGGSAATSAEEDFSRRRLRPRRSGRREPA